MKALFFIDLSIASKLEELLRILLFSLKVSEYEPALLAPKDYSFQESSDDCSSYWVGHCIIQDVTKSKDEPDILEVKMDLHRSSSDFPEGLVTEGGNRCTVNVIHRSLPHR